MIPLPQFALNPALETYTHTFVAQHCHQTVLTQAMQSVNGVVLLARNEHDGAAMHGSAPGNHCHFVAAYLTGSWCAQGPHPQRVGDLDDRLAVIVIKL